MIKDTLLVLNSNIDLGIAAVVDVHEWGYVDIKTYEVVSRHSDGVLEFKMGDDLTQDVDKADVYISATIKYDNGGEWEMPRISTNWQADANKVSETMHFCYAIAKDHCVGWQND